MTEVDTESARCKDTRWVPTGERRTKGNPVFKKVKVSTGVEIPDMDTLPPIDPKTGKEIKQFLEPLPGLEVPPKSNQN